LTKYKKRFEEMKIWYEKKCEKEKKE